jgi:amino acid adenylation domain-containing protein/non-ribosomal peptide synthase protein (TIGR01720 family)
MDMNNHHNAGGTPGGSQEMLDIALRIASLPPEKRALFRQRLQERGIGHERLPIVPLAERPAQLPLSAAQQRLWFLDRLEPGSAAYNIPAALRLSGALDAGALRAAFEAVGMRHETLRTTFIEADGAARLRIAPTFSAALPVIDLEPLPAARREAEALRLAQAEAATPFDLGSGPLLRTTLLRLAGDDHVLLVTMHHIVSDGWSMNVLLRELAACYAAALGAAGPSGAAASLPPLPLQYADVALWQREWLGGDALAPQLAYWRQRLGAEQPVLELPSDRARPSLPSGRGAKVRFTVDAALARDLRRLAMAQGATLFAPLLAAFSVLLHRLSGQRDLRIGVPVANRNRIETEGLIGFFVNTLVLRTEVDGAAPFAALLEQVRKTTLEAQSHADLPLERLVDALQPQRNLAHAPLFQAMFNLQSAPPASFGLPGLALQTLPQDSGATQFDLTLDVLDRGDRLDAVLTYSTDLFDAATIERHAGHFTNLLRTAAADPQARVAALDMLDTSERHNVTRGWNTAPLDEAYSGPVHRLFEARAAATPDAPALLFDDTVLSYGELNARANRLAHRLLALGIGADSRVGVCMQRSPEMVTALLAILKAGGAYVPLDPAYPAERLAYMMDHAGIALLLTQARVAADLQAIPAGVATEYADGPCAGYAESNPAMAVHPGQLAYVMYTSGSTGKPKGVGISHAALAAHAGVARGFFGLKPGERMLQFATFNFDGFVEQLYPALTCGAAVVLRGPDLWDSEELHARILRHRIDVMDLTTAYWFQVVQDWATGEARDYGTLRQVNVGGEAMPPEGLTAWRAAGLSHVRLLNTYGPTEAAVTAMVHDCAPYVTGGTPRPAHMPIGHALPGRSIYLLDRDGNPVPAGVPGELCIGGALLARGYHGRPDLTAERFIPDPFGLPGARLYRTGDLARWRGDGVIEYIGRIDHQVKIRGFRIELPEIEACLLAHPAVREAVVLARADQPGDMRLVAYVVTHDRPGLDALRAHLKAALPDYMVPSALVHLDAMPMNPNGKLDRHALPAPEAAAATAGYVAPCGAAEAALAAIWAGVLGVEQVGAHDNFFELGGDSILVLQVVSRCRRAGWQVSPRHLFQHQTVAALALAMGEAAPATLPASAGQAGATGEAPLTPIQHWFFEQDFTDAHHWNQSILLQAHAPVDAARMERALAALVRHHGALRLRFAREGKAWRQAYGGDTHAIPLRAIDLRNVADDALARQLHVACDAVQASLDLENGPLLGAAHVTLPDGAERLLLVAHHLVVDGVSWRILLEDLQSAYTQLAGADAAILPPASDSYRAWAERLQAYAASAACLDQLPYWLSAVQPMALPVLDAGAPNLAGDARRIDVRLDADTTRRLLQQAPAAYRTQINDLLLSALAGVVCRWSGASHALVELEGHGREDLFDGVDVSRTVGWFTSRYPVCLAPAGDAAATIKAVKEQLRRVPHNGFGWGALEYLADAETRAALAALPKPRISFNYFGQFTQSGGNAGAQAFSFARESDGDTASPRGRRSHWLEVNALVSGDTLTFGWTFNPALHARADIEQLAQSYLEELQALVAHCLAAEGGATPSDFPLAAVTQAELDVLPAAAMEDLYPLAPMQQGMLFHSLYAPQDDVYVNQFHCVLRGGVEPGPFRAAWEQAVARHPVLRTSFLWQRAGEPLQAVWRHAALPFDLLDWCAVAPDEHPARLQAWMAADEARGFALEQAPLMRIALIERHDGALDFVWTSHHLLLDGWSTAHLLDEVLASYFALCDGRAADIARPRRYRDYVELTMRQPRGAAEQWWRGQLAGLSGPLRLADALPRAAQPQAGHGELAQWLTEADTAALQHCAQRSQVTLNTLLQGAWALLLWRYSGRRDVVFGATVAGRPAELAGVDGMVGLFINTLPVVCHIDPAAPAAAWLRRLQADNADARQHETTPLAEVQRWSGAGNGSNAGALFDSLLVFENYPVDSALRQAGARLQVETTRKADRSNYPLTLTAVPGAQLRLSLTYDRGAVGAAAAQQLQTHLARLLRNLARQEHAPLDGIALLDAAEARALTEDRNATATAWPDNLPAHALVARQAATAPDRVALVSGADSVRYGELDAQANRLAHLLARGGAGPGKLAGVCMERGPGMVIALLAILKTGAGYVPLDPAYPPQRLSAMIDDAGMSVLLTSRAVRARLALERPGMALLETDTLGAELAAMPATAPHVRISPDSLAYVIYTSGSTGKPKGVMVRHGALTNFLYSMHRAPGLHAGDVLAAVTSLSFDIAALEIFLPLVCGARLLMLERECAADGARLAAALDAAQATVLQATPATWRMLVDSGWQGRAGGLKGLCGGEALAPDLASALLARGVSLWNMYGPTETTIWSALAPVGAVSGNPPLGAPIANTGIYLLDGELSPVPPGAPGELYIGGEGLARGYLGRPDLTAERFIASPFGAPGARLYRTGDIARWGAGGAIEYLGRSDHQVKIRGFRIEPGEIAACLQQHGAVKEAVVVALPSGQGEQRLVAYVVPRDAAAPQAAELDAHVRRALPAYMAPSAIVLLDAMPLTPNGKLDRKALPAPVAQEQDGYVAPRTETEATLARIWAEVLGVPQPGIHDDFFALGGHSLLATRLVSRIRQAFGGELPVRALFDAPTVAQLAAHAALAVSGAACDAGQAPLPVLPRRDGVPYAGEGGLPLSFAQQRLWFLHQLEPRGGAYNMAMALRLRGAADIGALRAAFAAVVRRHAALRTTFAGVDGEARQVIAPAANLAAPPLPLLDLSRHADAATRARRLADAEAAEPFDLAAGPLLRLKLLKLADADHVLLATLHHIVADGWSVSILAREFATAYAVLAQDGGATAPLAALPPLPVQYADFAAWQRQRLAGAELERQLQYWTAYLGTQHPVLELPSDRPRPAAQSGRGAVWRWHIGAELAEPLRQLCRRQGCTLFMGLLSVFGVLLHRLSGQDSLRIGVPSANRDRLETEGLIGLFVNTHVLRIDTGSAGNADFSALLEQVRGAALGAQAHAELPFELLVEALQPQRNLAHAPLFQAMFNLAVGAGSGMAMPPLPGLDAQPFQHDGGSTQFDLSLDVSDRGAGLDAVFTYSTDLFEAATIERFAAYYTNLLRAALARPHARIGDLAMLPATELHQLTATWNDTATAYPDALPVHLQFERQAARTPDAVALVADGQRLTYRELNAAANRLAHRLIGAGVTPDMLVGICAQRSAGMVAGLLAILKAGGAYVPLDPDYPAERLAYMLDDARTGVLLAPPALASTLGLDRGCRVLALSGPDDSASCWPEHNPGLPAHPGQLAYTIYTSGSTGQPKGAGVPHGGLANRLAWMQQAYRLQADDRVLQKTPFGFDVSVWEFFWPLITGATLVMAPPGAHRDPAHLAALIREHGVTTLHFVPSMLQAFAEHGALPQCVSLRRVLASGEALPAELVQRHYRQGNVPLHNLYGPTEASIDVTAWACSAGDDSVPIGRPIANTQVYVLDHAMNPVPAGAVGELYIGGVQLARGYHRRPGLTAERFVPDPFGPPGARLYRSGDLARWRGDGAVEYLGRTDHQVKLRGLRIELGEIEARLLAHPQVREAAVLARGDSPGGLRLVGYVVAGADGGAASGIAGAASLAAAPTGAAPVAAPATVTADALRAHLLATLPDYMAPSAWVFLDAMPLSPNGKLDRKALPEPAHGAGAGDYAAPRDEREAALAAIFAEVLDIGQAGIHDDFFDLGGHSLLATRLVSRIRQQLQVELPVRALFEAPTVAQLAQRLRQHGAGGAGSAPPLVRTARGAALPLSYAQQRLWFLQQLEPDSAAYNIASALRLAGQLDRPALEAAFQALVERHEVLRTTFAGDDGDDGAVHQRIAAQAGVSLAVRDLRGVPPQERLAQAHQMAAYEAARPFDLATGPLLRVMLLQLDAQEHLLLVTMHHIVADGWSMGVLVREFAALYTAFRAGQPSPLAPLALQYADFAVWQRQWLSGAELERQLAFWKRQLGRDHLVLDLPADRPRPAVLSGHGGRHRFTISHDTVQQLHGVARAQGASLFMAMLAALDVWLHAHTGRTDPVVGADIANRNRAETEGLVGFFVNQLALRADLSGNPSYGGLLHQTAQRVLDAYAHQDLPFDMLVEAINPVRSLAHAPLFQVKLVLHNQQEQRLSLPGLEVAPEPSGHNQVQLDLLLMATETDAGLDCILEYSTDLFEPATAAAFAAEYTALLAHCAAEPGATVDTLARGVSAMARQSRLERQQALAARSLGKLQTVRRKTITSMNTPTQKDQQS